MSYKIQYNKSADKCLAKMDRAVIRRILRRMHWLSENFDITKSEKLRGGFKNLYKLRIGDWRVIYRTEIKSQTLIVWFIGHRSEIYKLK